MSLSKCVASILDQPFVYLARGCKLHAFRAADGRHVLKTPTTADEIIAWYASDGLHLADLAWARPRGATDRDRAAAIRQSGLASAALAWDHLRDETALHHVELAPGGWSGSPRIELGNDLPPLDPAREPFIIQRYADLVGPRLKHAATAGDTPACRRVLDDVVDLTRQLWAAGIAEDTMNFANNCGYVDGVLVQIDVGEFTASRDLVLRHAAEQRILQRKSFRRLRRNYPDLADYFAARVGERLSPAAVREMWRQRS